VAWLVALAVIADASSTILGLSLPGAGPVAQRLIPVLGVAYFAVEYGVLYGLSRILESRGLPSSYAQLAASVGPWLAGWTNIGLVLRISGVV